MKIYILMEKTRSHDDGIVMSAWTTRKGAEKEAERLAWRETLGYFVKEVELQA
jgi:hypothetical protein